MTSPLATTDGQRTEDLVRAAQGGSREAFGHLVERFGGPLYNFLRLRATTSEDAEELAQESFLRAWSKLGSYRSTWKFSTWLFTVARRLAVSHYRATHRRPANVPLVEDRGSTASDPSLTLSRREERGRIWAIAERELSAAQCSALWLRYAEDFSIAEIARILDRSPTTVRVLLFRARERLGRHLEPMGSGGGAVGGDDCSEPAQVAGLSRRCLGGS